MYERSVQPANLGLDRLLLIFAGLSVVFVLALAVAPAKSYFSEWRTAQARYNALAQAQQVAPLDPAVQQAWIPRLGVVDRCGSCHLGAAGLEPVGGEKLFSAHPKIPHDPADLGCTPCHGGQGRATKKDAAHGHVRFWEQPMLDRTHLEAGCGSCHTHWSVSAPAQVSRGRDLFARYDCTSCHTLGRAGRGTAPDLTHAGVHGYSQAWLERHPPGQGPGALPPDDKRAIEAFLSTRYGADRLMEGKALAHTLGCRGCHKISGVGGDDGPDLTRMGLRTPHDLDYSNVEGPHTLPNWLYAHFLAPDRVVPGSKMPALGITGRQAEALTLYMLSLRPLEAPQEYWPKDRLAGVRLGQRDYAQDGATLYGVFCAACHGEHGEGRRFPNAGIFPAIGSRDFLAIADDEMIRQTITHGRPGRRMPAWGSGDGGLSRDEIDRVVAFVRSFQPDTPEPWDQELPRGDAARGEPLYTLNCSGCHGRGGEGVLGPELKNPAFQAVASDSFIARTMLRGRAAAGMRHFGTPSSSFPALSLQDAADVTAFIRTLPKLGQGRPKE